MRKDGRFIQLPGTTVDRIRKAKQDGYSLRDIETAFGIARSTASLYCRDLFWYPGRLYETEEQAREAVALRGFGRDYAKYHHCVDCGKRIRNKHVRCLTCNLTFQDVSGERARFMEASIATRFALKNKEAFRRKTIIMRFTEFTEGDRVVVIMPKGSGYDRPLEVTVVDKMKNGNVTLQKDDGRRFYTNSHRIKRVLLAHHSYQKDLT